MVVSSEVVSSVVVAAEETVVGVAVVVGAALVGDAVVSDGSGASPSEEHATRPTLSNAAEATAVARARRAGR
ncbi:hypothetical protein B842_02980 [Corynebacterium humireducens NBRC 106098 = DSM 45392]|uniref:Uncharacterized protein n=1 Tax=Corynebacterium humireducens NBRC 106098 = DSM 45392 TaxID=1223515 RepID=A0A0B5D9T3_9CORY|nr:hypothetical protein B842_02980 [Corynebacterium humireducens NBRC 106098 = DSM 45392]